jgi:serine protease Do
MKNKFYFIVLFGVLNYPALYASQPVGIDQTWQQVQSIAHNAVVQIFATSRDTNWFNPYCVNGTKNGSGTGFFINENGDIATCSHVVEEAISVFICLPSFGQQRFKVNVVGICPESDIALLRLTPESLTFIRKELGHVPYLQLSDSNDIHGGEEILVLGYPLGDKELKATVGILSAHLNRSLQYDVATNPGNSGGPVFNKKGMIVGIHSRGNKNAQGTNFAVPINIFKVSLSDLYNHKLLKINNNFGIIWMPTNQEIRTYFGNTEGQGCFVCDLDSLGKAFAAGLRKGDIIYEVNGHDIDNYGEVAVLCDGGKIKFDEYIGLLPLGAHVYLNVYRNGMPLSFVIVIDSVNTDTITRKYPAYEKIEYEVFAGMIVMSLTVNYIEQCEKQRPGLKRYMTSLYNNGPRLVIANIIANSKLDHIKTMRWADTINEVNGISVNTLDDFRKALTKSVETGIVVIRTTDETYLNTDNALTVLSLYDSCKETVELSHVHQYPLSETIIGLIKQVDSSLL